MHARPRPVALAALALTTAPPGRHPAAAGAGRFAVVAPDTMTTEYVVSGVHVIQRWTPNDDVIALDLYLAGGVQQLSAANAGVEELALRASEYGSARYPLTRARRAWAHTGSRWVVDPEADWSMVGFRSTGDQFDSTWSVFADRIVHPTLDSAAVGPVRARMMGELRLRQLTPEAAVYDLADSLAFIGHPYALHPSGTESALAGLTAGYVREYVHDQFVTSRMLLVVVGNVSRTHLERLVASTLGTLPAGSYTWSPPPPVPRRPTSLSLVQRVTATNYILGYFAGPSVSSPDYPAFRVAMLLLSGGLAGAIRGRTSLSYAAYAPYQDRAVASGGMYATTATPSLVLALMRQQLEFLKSARFPGYALDRFIKELTGQALLERETNAAQAAALARAQLLEGNYRKADGVLAGLRHVSPDDVARVAKAYMRDIQFVYVGDTTRVRRDWVKSM